MAVGAAVNAAATVPRPVGISTAQELQMLQSGEVANASDASAGAAAGNLQQADEMDRKNRKVAFAEGSVPIRCRTALCLGTCQADAEEWRVLVDGPTGKTYFWNIRSVRPDCVRLIARLIARRREVAGQLLQGERTWTCPEARVS